MSTPSSVFSSLRFLCIGKKNDRQQGRSFVSQTDVPALEEIVRLLGGIPRNSVSYGVSAFVLRSCATVGCKHAKQQLVAP